MKTSKPVSAGQIAIVISVAVILIASIIALTVYLNKINSDDESALNKNVALGALFEKDVLTGTFNGKKIIITQKDIISEMFKSSEWKYLPNYNADVEKSLVLNIDDNYTLSVCENEIVEIIYEDKSRYYSAPSDVLPSVSAYLYDNSYLSPQDASAFLSASDNITVYVLGSSKTVASGAKLSSALGISDWTEIDSANPDFEPTVVIDTKNGLKISVYKSINIGVIEYNGSDTVYSVEELSVASAEFVAKSYFNDLSSLFNGKLNEEDTIVLSKGGQEFNLSPDTTLDTLLDVAKWERRFTAPAGLPSKSDIVISSGQSFTINLYSTYSVAEFENVYYSVPTSVFSAVSEYLNPATDSKESVSTLKTVLSNSIFEKKQVSVQYKKNGYIVSVHPDFLSALGISSWTESPVLELFGEPDLVFEINKVPSLSLSFYTVKNSVTVINGNEKQVYRIPSSISGALINYVQENLYTEAWSISATELGALQKNAEGVDVTVTDAYSFREKYSEETDDALSVLAALDLIPSDSVPEITETEKTEILFKGAEKFLMILYPASEGGSTVNVTGTFYSKGKYIDRWFVCSSDYSEVVNSLMKVNEKSSDTAAALFCESLRTGDIDTINRLIGNSSFDYSGIKTLMLNHLTIENADGHGVYTVKMNVEDPVDSPFEKGIKNYILTVGSSGGSLIVRSFIPEDEYETLSLSDPAVAAVDGFTSWVDAAGIVFDSIDSFENRSAVAAYLLMLCKRDSAGTASEDNSSLLLVSADEMNAAAKKYFGVDKFDASDIPSYNPETNMYSYEGISAPTRYKRVSSLNYDDSGYAFVTYKWYSDPLCLYCTNTVIYTLKNNGDDTFAIISASLPGAGIEIVEQPPEDQPEENTENIQESDQNEQNGQNNEQEEPNTETEEQTPSFIPPSGLTPTETLFKFFEYLNEKDTEKANSLLYEAYARSEEEYAFDDLTKISVKSCAEVPSDYDWYDPWYRSPADYVCVVAEVSVDCNADKWYIYNKDSSSVEVYMIKTSDDSDWRIISEKPSGEGILSNH
ncbi:MAG: hypothetical protein IJL30_01065 [Clostridia bacterium]|nr:hypothetical protein [Clostridia bacterium]